jgi:hypothetical protein
MEWNLIRTIVKALDWKLIMKNASCLRLVAGGNWQSFFSLVMKKMWCRAVGSRD